MVALFKKAFSLVELSIVLVILGLLTGGILAGQSLIRASELRGVGTEYTKWVTAVAAFRDKYFAVPGDFSQATAVWKFQKSAGCNYNTSPYPGTDVANGVCDGNGNGVIDNAAAASQAGEIGQFWRELTSAGLIEGSYSGFVGAGGTTHCVIGTDCPRSKLNAAGWGVSNLSNYGGDAVNYAVDYGNYFTFGAQTANGVPYNPILKPEEAWNIDTKLDDGVPGTGKIVIGYRTTCATSSGVSDYSAPYALSTTTPVCILYFVRVF